MTTRILVLVLGIFVVVCAAVHRMNNEVSIREAEFISKMHCADSKCELTMYRVGSSSDPEGGAQ